VFSPIKFATSEIIVPADYALHAYKPPLPAVKTGQPHDLSGKDSKFPRILKMP